MKVRGQRWAQSVAEQMIGVTEPWPPYRGKAAAIARRKVAALTPDKWLAERLAQTCHAQAASWWAHLQAQ